MRIKKGDNVQVRAGKDRGKTGKVVAVDVLRARVTVDGLNTVLKRARPRRQGEKGQTISVSRPVHASNVLLVCGSCKKASRTGMRNEGGAKVRYCKRCNATV